MNEEFIIQLKPFINNKKVNKHLGNHWIAKHQEFIFEEMFGQEPSKHSKVKKDNGNRALLSRIILTKGVFSDEAKTLKAQINSNEQEKINPDYQIWVNKKLEILGSLININDNHSVYKSKHIDPFMISQKTFEQAIIEIEELEQEKYVAKKILDEKEEISTPQVYSSWILGNIFGKQETPEWITTKEGQIIYVGADLDTVVSDHLGMKLSKAKKAQFLNTPFDIGYRYWKTNQKGQLAPPIITNSGGFWAPGINQCQGKWATNKYNSVGLYAFAHNKKTICPKTYFDIHTGKRSGTRVPITACCMWENKSGDSSTIIAKYAAPAAILILPGDSKSVKTKMEKIADIYHMQIASSAKEMKKAAEKWHKNTLPQFFL